MSRVRSRRLRRGTVVLLRSKLGQWTESFVLCRAPSGYLIFAPWITDGKTYIADEDRGRGWRVKVSTASTDDRRIER